MKKFFFTGTGTNVGKTHVMCQWMQRKSEKGVTVHGLKPIASGSELIAATEVWLDEELIKSCNKLSLPVTWYRFSEPIAPHIAAMQAGVLLTVKDLITKIESQVYTGVEELYIEGAGGLLVPLNHSETWVDFARQANLEIILVVGMTLGCINHALLTEQFILANNLAYHGWISNAVDQDMLCQHENLNTLKALMQGTYLGHEPYLITNTVSTLED